MLVNNASGIRWRRGSSTKTAVLTEEKPPVLFDRFSDVGIPVRVIIMLSLFCLHGKGAVPVQASKPGIQKTKGIHIQHETVRMTQTERPNMSLADLVNPLQGTASEFTFSNGNTLPLISKPFAMTSWSAQTAEGRWFFHPASHQLQGIRATRQPSPWIGDYGHFTVMPQTGRRFLNAKMRASSFRPDHTEYRPYYFKTYLGRYRVTIEVTPTERCALFRFTFPKTDAARVIVQPFEGDSQITIDPEKAELRGYTRANSGGVPEGFACYFVARFDCPLLPAELGLFDEDEIWESEMQKSGERIGAYVGLEPPENHVVHMRIGTSFISEEQAARNLETEIGARIFDELEEDTHHVWEQALRVVKVEGATEEQLRTFYSALYRCVLFPRMWYEYDEAGKPVHFSPYDGQVHHGYLYADHGFWDVHRTQYPLLSILFPERLSEIIQGWVEAYKEGGWFPKWSSPGYRACMIGTHIDAVIADAYVKGVRDFDVETAYAGMIKHATTAGDPEGAYGRKGIEDFIKLGYVPADKIEESVSRTLDFAYNDFCIAQIAKGLGHEDDYKMLRRRALNYRNVYDPSVGFMRGKSLDGSWTEPFCEFAWGGPYVEGGVWQCGWAVPHDPFGLIELMGGKQKFLEKLDRMLSTPPYFEVGNYGVEIHEMTEMASVDFGQYAHSNQPVHHVLYLFAAAGAPARTQYWVRRVLDELYSPGADGFAGDEDNGEMSAWYILSSLGTFPLCPGHPSYVFGSPLFKKAIVHLSNGKTFEVEGVNNSPENVYVKNIMLNGMPYKKSFITHQQLVDGCSLKFLMDSKPSGDSRISDEDLPFSLSNLTKD